MGVGVVLYQRATQQNNPDKGMSFRGAGSVNGPKGWSFVCGSAGRCGAFSGRPNDERSFLCVSFTGSVPLSTLVPGVLVCASSVSWLD